jgi:hypothetical protein
MKPETIVNVRIFKIAIWLFILLSALIWVFCNGPDDGGWYLNASLKVANGKIPHLDFMFPQGPLMAYCFALPAAFDNPVLWGRLWAVALALLGIFFFTRSLAKQNPGAEVLFLFGIMAFPISVSYLSLVKTHAPVVFLLGLTTLLIQKERRFLAIVCLGAAASLRLSLAPLWLLYVFYSMYCRQKAAYSGFLMVLALFAGWGLFTEWKIFEQLFLPFGFYQPNEVTSSFSTMKGQLDNFEMIIRKPVAVLRCFLSIPVIIFYWLAPRRATKEGKLFLFGSLILFLSHLLADRPYEEYQIPAIFLLLYALCLRIDFSERLIASGKRFAAILLIMFLLPWFRVAGWEHKSNYLPYLLRLQQQSEYLNQILPDGEFLPFDAYLTLYSKRKIEDSAWLGQFSFLPDARNKFVEKYGLHNRNSFQALLNKDQVASVLVPDLSMGKDKLCKMLVDHPGWQQGHKLPDFFADKALLFLRKEKKNGKKSK